ncbi:MAG: isopentenyl transferase family protein, partial [Clostridia bacterium]
MEKQRVLAVVGATASGKSDLALWLCEQLNAELICMDSMQIYRHMDIGTAKPTPAERSRVPHHLLDIV